MSFTEARILTIQWDTRTGMFDDSVLRNHLVNRELVRCVPQFFEHKWLPCPSLSRWTAEAAVGKTLFQRLDQIFVGHDRVVLQTGDFRVS